MNIDSKDEKSVTLVMNEAELSALSLANEIGYEFMHNTCLDPVTDFKDMLMANMMSGILYESMKLEKTMADNIAGLCLRAELHTQLTVLKTDNKDSFMYVFSNEEVTALTNDVDVQINVLSDVKEDEEYASLYQTYKHVHEVLSSIPFK